MNFQCALCLAFLAHSSDEKVTYACAHQPNYHSLMEMRAKVPSVGVGRVSTMYKVKR